MKQVKWQLYTYEGHSLRRAAHVVEGFDCRKVCKHDPPRDHGCSGDKWHLAIRLDDYALDLMLSTDVVNGQRLSGRNVIEPAFVFLHSAFPTTEVAVRLGWDAEDCPLIGKCYPHGEPMGREADALWLRSHTQYAEGFALENPATVTQRLLSMEGVWDRLAARLFFYKQRAVEAHRALPRQCPRCEGRGTVPKTEKNSLAFLERSGELARLLSDVPTLVEALRKLTPEQQDQLTIALQDSKESWGTYELLKKLNYD